MWSLKQRWQIKEMISFFFSFFLSLRIDFVSVSVHLWGERGLSWAEGVPSAKQWTDLITGAIRYKLMLSFSDLLWTNYFNQSRKLKEAIYRRVCPQQPERISD